MPKIHGTRGPDHVKMSSIPAVRDISPRSTQQSALEIWKLWTTLLRTTLWYSCLAAIIIAMCEVYPRITALLALVFFSTIPGRPTTRNLYNVTAGKVLADVRDDVRQTCGKHGEVRFVLVSALCFVLLRLGISPELVKILLVFLRVELDDSSAADVSFHHAVIATLLASGAHLCWVTYTHTRHRNV